MPPNLTSQKLLGFIIGDFETAWNAVAGLPSSSGSRGNFMFAKQVMILLELACRLCKSDPTGSALSDFSSEIEARDSRYFWQLPARVWKPSARTQADLSFPTRAGVDSYQHILAAIFNLVRNGQAHQYQQIQAKLKGGSTFGVSLTGAAENFFLHTVLSHGRPSDHLSYNENGNDISLIVRPDVLFLDIRDSVRAAQLETRTLRYLNQRFDFDKRSLKESLDNMNGPTP